MTLRSRLLALALGAAALLAAPDTASAQTSPYVPLVDWETRLNIEERLQPLGDDLMGDRIDPHTGALTFLHTDISIPGDSGMPVALTRRLVQGRIFGGAGAHFADWQLVAPRITVVTADIRPWNGDRCTEDFNTQFASVPMGSANFIRGYEYSNGVTLEVAGSSEPLLQSPSNAPWPAGTSHVTNSNWRFTCIGSAQFLGRSPDGSTYRFDRHIVRNALPLKMAGGLWLDRDTHILAATEVTDRHGNWVRYEYDAAGRLTRIHANDGREITLAYSGASPLVSSASANGRTWTYTYRPGTQDDGIWAPAAYDGAITTLGSVTLPDGRSWTFQLDGMHFTNPPSQQCLGAAQMSMTHPAGAVGEFDTAVQLHRFSYDKRVRQTEFCPSHTLDLPTQDPNFEVALIDGAAIPIFSVVRKALIAPGAPTATWTFTYEQDTTTQTSWSDPTNWTKVDGPHSHRTLYHLWTEQAEGGALVREEGRAQDGGPVLDSVAYEYVTEGWYGSPGPDLGVPVGLDRQPRRLIRTETTRDGTVYTQETDYVTNALAADYSWGNPVELRSFSTLAGASMRTVEVDYLHDSSAWVLGLPTRVTRNGKVFEEIGYSAARLPVTIDHFGARVETRSYNADGTLAWVRDGLNRQTSLSNYYRGHPRTITRADSSQILLQVDADGRITQITNARGITTGYSYNASGWLTLIDHPSGHDNTTISYSSLGAGVVMTRTRGALEVRTVHDRFHRPVQVRQRALSGGGGSIYTGFEYDALGRTIFQSFPSSSASPTAGVETEYDALGRVVRTAQTVSPYAATLTAYLSGNRTRVTDPLGNITTTHATGYAGPGDGEPIRIDHPLGLTTQMGYDAWGNLTSARQYGSHSGFSVDETQTWAYDSRLRLCRHATPQSGHTLYAYDAANQMIGEARGAPAGTGCAALPGASTVTTSYDLLGRADIIDFPDTSPDIDYSYDANGNMISAARGSNAWSYTYDAMDQLTTERLDVDGRTYLNDYIYRTDGRLSARRTPDRRFISLNPNGHGRPNWAKYDGVEYAGSAVYHPSGQLASASYSNGLDYLATFNARQQMTSQRVAAGSSDRLHYSYAHDGLGRVTSITDHVTAAESRAYGYDALGRLTSATGPWGAGSYTYDLLNNIREKALGLRTVELEYNSQGRLHRYRDTNAGFAWRTHVYDDRGNTAANGVFAFHYDRSEQPVAISGPVGGGYAYDAHRRRVMQVHNGDVIYTLYALDGTLLYRDNATTGETTDYIAMGGHSVGRFDETGTFTWTHGDHLGSASAATNATGAILWTESYTPFGEVLQDPLGNRDEAGFTGHIRDAATGLTYAQARFYDPVIARFYAPDPVGFAGGGPGYFNRYAYTMNDPVNLVDPTGEWWLRAAKFIAGQIRRTRDFQRRYKEEVQGLPVQPAPVVISEMGERGGSAGAPPLPGGIVGEGSQQGGGRINSGPLLPEYGGTGNAQEDFETLTGGVPGAAPPTAPEGTRAGENGIQIRPGRPAEEGRPATGPRIDIPASGDKPRETLHYPPEEAQETEDAG